MSDEHHELWAPKVQGLPPDEVAAAAREGLAREWERLWELPLDFYHEKFRAAGLGPGEVPPLDAIPRTVKGELRADQAAHPPFGRYRSLSIDEALRIGSSTGTTGSPTLIFYGPRDLEAHIEAGARNLWRYGMRPGERFTHSWPQGMYPTAVSGGQTYLRTNLLEISVGPPFSPEAALEHLEMWKLLEPHGFMMTSSQHATYEQVAAEQGIDFAGMLDGARVAFLEPSCQFEGPRRRIEEAYGFRMHNLGGASEVPGFSVSDCRFHTGLHARGDMARVQACDPETGREVPDGERGTLVISTFGIDAFVMRYDVEDIVTVDTGTCPCGETGPRYTYLGRRGDAVEIDGRLVLPIDVQRATFDAFGTPEFQLVPDAPPDVLRLRIEAEGSADDIAAHVSEELGVAVEAEAVPPGTLPRSAFKPRRVAR